MNIDHINICAPLELLKTEKEFFCNVFNLCDGFRPNFSDYGYWLYSGDKAIIHLTESNNHLSNNRQGHIDHFAFKLTNVQKFIETLVRLGIHYSTVNLEEISITQVFIKSPLNIKIEVNFPMKS